MTENKNYCMGCMKEISPDETICPHCSYNSLASQTAPFLGKGNIISGKYLVGKVESFSVDSITYIGLDTETGTTVNIIEFYPEKIVSRPINTSQVNIKSGYEEMFRATLQSFIDLWTDLKETTGFACLPQVTDILLYNATAYAVCRYKDYITLESYFKEKPPLSPKKAISAFKGIAMALKKLHSIGVIHGSISPKSVFVGADGKIHLGRFTIKQCHSVNTELRARPISGFAPLELYGDEPQAGPHSDIYSFMALLYYAITGTVPADSTKRAVKDEMILPSQVAEKLADNEVSAIIRGLAVQNENRISDVGELMAILYAPKAVQQRTPQSPRPVPVKKTAEKQPKEKKAVPAVKAEKNPKAKPDPVKKAKAAKEPKKSSASNNIIPVMAATFGGVIVACFVIFSILYTTVLYKNYDIPFMNSMYSSLSFLPMNKEAEDVNNDYSNTTTTQSDTDYERSYVTVPDFSVYTYDSIQTNEVFNRNFTIKYKLQASKTYEKNAVISQSLTAGESVLSGTEITIVISEGIAQIELIDVIGMPYQAAKEKLEHAGFIVKQELRKNDGSQPEGEVFLMSKVAGLEFDEGTEIVLSVWDEAETTTENSEEDEESTTKKKETTTKKTED
ncbi:MAG: PASTA domain-containing protein [Clostridia bacterium]|nr:PASTA domain-containing protein [Clostridia bacterium]